MVVLMEEMAAMSIKKLRWMLYDSISYLIICTIVNHWVNIEPLSTFYSILLGVTIFWQFLKLLVCRNAIHYEDWSLFDFMTTKKKNWTLTANRKD